MEFIRNLILFVLGGGLLLLTLRSLRAHRLKERYVIIFILIGFPFLFLGFWTEGVGYIGKILGIDYRTISLLGVTFFFILLFFKLLSVISIHERHITKLAQEIAFLTQYQQNEIGLLNDGIEKNEVPRRKRASYQSGFKSNSYLGGHVVSPQTPLPRVYPTASERGIIKCNK